MMGHRGQDMVSACIKFPRGQRQYHRICSSSSSHNSLQALFSLVILPTRSNASRRFLLSGANCEGAGSSSNINAVSDHVDAELFAAHFVFQKFNDNTHDQINGKFIIFFSHECRANKVSEPIRQAYQPLQIDPRLLGCLQSILCDSL
jgi:hypothetical protein